MDWYVVKYSQGKKIKRPVHVLNGNEDTTIWTPTFENGTPFTYSRARRIAKIKSHGNKLAVINREELDRYTLEWYLEEQVSRLV